MIGAGEDPSMSMKNAGMAGAVGLIVFGLFLFIGDVAMGEADSFDPIAARHIADARAR